MAVRQGALLLYLLFLIFHTAWTLSMLVILGDTVKFQIPANCSTKVELNRLEADKLRAVAALERGVCKPSEEYKDRVDSSSCFTLNRSFYTDTALYEFNCGKEPIQLKVAVAFYASVAEGAAVKLSCFFNTAGQTVDSVRWEKNMKLLLEKNFKTGTNTSGSEFKEEMRLTPNGDKHGDWSLMWDRAEEKDEGDYSCSFYKNGVREKWGDPAAVRLKVSKTDQDEGATTVHPPTNPPQTVNTWMIIGIVAVVVLPVLFFCLGWLAKSCSPEATTGSCCRDSQSSQSSQQVQSSQSSQEAQQAQSSQEAQSSQSSQEAQQAQSSQEAQQAQSSQEAQSSQSSQEAQQAQSSQEAQQAQSSQQAQHAQSSQEAQSSQSSQEAQPLLSCHQENNEQCESSL